MALELTADLFEGHVGRTFSIEGDPRSVVLTGVERRPLQASEAGTQVGGPFTLVFSGPPRDVLAEGIRTLRTETEDQAFDLYLMPVHTPAPDRQDYQAVFN